MRHKAMVQLRADDTTHKATERKILNAPSMTQYTIGIGILGFCGDWSGLGGSGIIRGWLPPTIFPLRELIGVQMLFSDRMLSRRDEDERRPSRDGRGAGAKASAPAAAIAAINKARLIIFRWAAARGNMGLGRI